MSHSEALFRNYVTFISLISARNAWISQKPCTIWRLISFQRACTSLCYGVSSTIASTAKAPPMIRHLFALIQGHCLLAWNLFRWEPKHAQCIQLNYVFSHDMTGPLHDPCHAHWLCFPLQSPCSRWLVCAFHFGFNVKSNWAQNRTVQAVSQRRLLAADSCSFSLWPGSLPLANTTKPLRLRTQISYVGLKHISAPTR